jgi:hypothetical protein
MTSVCVLTVFIVTVHRQFDSASARGVLSGIVPNKLAMTCAMRVGLPSHQRFSGIWTRSVWSLS